ncbi:hypothetical protein BH24PSE2_BH24PSE2_02430 [soil metagenome]
MIETGRMNALYKKGKMASRDAAQATAHHMYRNRSPYLRGCLNVLMTLMGTFLITVIPHYREWRHSLLSGLLGHGNEECPH